MKNIPSILLHTLTIILASEQGLSSLVCLYDSLQTVDCIWNSIENTAGAQCTLTGSVERTIHFAHNLCKTCELHGVGNRSCQLDFDAGSLTVSDTIRLAVSCLIGKNKTKVDVQVQRINPFQNIRLKPPCIVELENTSKTSYNLTWKLCVLSHYLDQSLEYQVLYKEIAASEGSIHFPSKSACQFQFWETINNRILIHGLGETAIKILGYEMFQYCERETEDPRILSIGQDQKWLKFEALPPDTVFEAAVRVKTQADSGYNSIWSKWSHPVTWRTYSKDQVELWNLHILLPVLVVGGFLTIFLIGITLTANSQMSKWLRKLLKIHLPDPSSFLPSLTAVHGDIQKWLSSPLSKSSFHITTASPDVSTLEIIQKGDQEPYFLLSKDYAFPLEKAETSGHSSTSCFTNHGYFFFHRVDALEIEPCKVYFTYDPFAPESSIHEDGDSYSYKTLHAADDNSPLLSYGVMSSKCVASSLPESMEPTQKGRICCEVLPSFESFSKASAEEESEDQEGNSTIIRSPDIPHQAFSSIPKQSLNNFNESEAIGNIGSLSNSMEDNRSPFLQSATIQGQFSHLCRTVSLSHIVSDEDYVSLTEIHHSV